MSIFRRISTPTKKVKTLSDRVQNSLVRDIENLYDLSDFAIGGSHSDASTFYNAINNGVCKVVMVGHSTCEGDVSQMEGHNIWAEEIMRQLSAKFPSVTFSHVNYGLASRNIAMFVDPDFQGVGSPDPGDNTGFYRASGTYSWQNASVIGKSWMNHVKDEHPDLVIMHFGLNSNGTAEGFKTDYETAIDSMRAWGKPPSIAILTDTLPTELSDPWLDRNGTIKHKNTKIREVTDEKKCILLDVGRQWDLLISGRDPLVMQERALTLDSLVQVSGTAPASITFNSLDKDTVGAANYELQSDVAYNCTITCDYVPNTTSSLIQMGLRFKASQSELYNEGIYVQVNDSNVKFWENAGSPLQNTAHSAITATQSHAVEIILIDDTITVKIDTVTVATYTITTKFDIGDFSIGLGDAAITNAVIMLNESYPIIATPRYTGNEMVGNKTATEWNNGDTRDGGNAITHPSRVGLAEGFYPVFREFVKNL